MCCISRVYVPASVQVYVIYIPVRTHAGQNCTVTFRRPWVLNWHVHGFVNESIQCKYGDTCNSQLIKGNVYTISIVVHIIVLFIIVDEAKAVRAFTRIFVLTAAGNG